MSERQSRRLGRFHVAQAFNVPENICLRRLMAKIIVWRVDYRINSDVLEYFAECDDFDLVDFCGHVPLYQVIFSGDPIVVSFRRES